MPRITRLLVANRGEIARRIMLSARRLGMATAVVYAEADAGAPFVAEADEAVRLPGEGATETYLNGPAVIAAARRVEADAVHPGYGFLAENATFAQAVLDAGLVWVGPPPETIAAMGDKLAAKERMAKAGVPTLPSVALDGLSAADLSHEVRRLGLPLLVKAAAGGGGRGMRIIRSADDAASAVAGAGREALAAFGDGRLFLEPYVDACRHVEVQILGDRHGALIHAFERECSIQRRHQKIVEEAPSPALTDELRARLCEAALTAGRAIRYVSAGTVEFLLDRTGRFHFLEVNTRLQVEHPVTEAITGLDLVEVQLRIARGEPLASRQHELARRGHAIEARLYAEDPLRDFLPSAGRVLCWEEPAALGVRIDAGVATGSVVSTHFDPLLAKVIAHGANRAEAAERLARALERVRVHGITTNRDFLVAVLRHDAFLAGDTTTDFIERHRPARRRRVPPAEVRLAAVAAALHGRALRHAESPLPTIPAGWRNNPSAMQRVTYRHDGEELEVRYARERDGSVTCEAGEWRASARVVRVVPSPPAGGAIELELDGIRRRVDVLADGAERWVQTPAGQVRLIEVDRFPRPEREHRGGGCVAPMPGRVVEVNVAVGDRVAQGRTLLVLEAMKMEHQVRAAFTGRVVEVRVTVGHQADRDEVLLVIEPDEPTAA
jgi:acyl-CoA carboxylase subunit alpha